MALVTANDGEPWELRESAVVCWKKWTPVEPSVVGGLGFPVCA